MFTSFEVNVDMVGGCNILDMLEKDEDGIVSLIFLIGKEKPSSGHPVLVNLHQDDPTLGIKNSDPILYITNYL